MQRLRLFLALELDSMIQECISNATKSIRGQTPNLRWVTKHNLHLTVRFLGQVPESKIPALRTALSETFATFCEFRLNFGAFGGFPTIQQCRVFWLGINGGNEECRNLKTMVDDALAPLGFPKEPKDFIPHVTLARAKREAVRIPSNFVETASVITAEDNAVVIRELTLFKSELTPSGPIYTKVFGVQFQTR